jgi:GNAT superfamily N-acetyltransferase
VIRPATGDDVALLEDIENAADGLFLQRFRPDTWAPAASGAWRAAQPGYLLVSADSSGGPAVGFVHVLEHEGAAHLEQVAVRPESARRGHGRALVLAALTEAGRRGHDRLTLRTYSDVPWNAPFYASLGFTESAPDTPFLRGIAASEERLGLVRWGRRIQMTVSLPHGRFGT